MVQRNVSVKASEENVAKHALYQRTFVSILVARGWSLHTHKPKVASFASKSGTFPMLIFAAGAQPVHLHPVQEKGETEGETMVSFGNKLKGLWN